MVETFAIPQAIHFSLIGNRPKLSFFMEDSGRCRMFLNSPINQLFVGYSTANTGEKFAIIDRFSKKVICTSLRFLSPDLLLPQGQS